ncbi:hypothetical protein [Streptomyces sp. 6N223]|uniref:hypothetical protein n=1 Tax=Streptomyces sp. 6N223 TaxID=3457412 RepID=UPI003FCF2CF0
MADDAPGISPGAGGLHVEPVDPARGAAGVTLRLTDSRTGRPAVIEPGYRHPLRVRAHLARPGNARHPHLPDLRTLLVADLLFRTAELYGGQALIGVTGEPGDALLARAADLGIHPPAAPGSPDLARHTDIDLIAPAAAAPTRGIRVDVATTHPRHAPERAEPLALRLALLTRAHDHAIDLGPGPGPGVLARAQDTLTRWRRQVADWAEAPSKPMCAEILGQALTALTENLAIPAVLDALHRLERDTAVPAGSRFETFAHLDRVLGLDLTRDVGRTYHGRCPGVRSERW